VCVDIFLELAEAHNDLVSYPSTHIHTNLQWTKALLIYPQSILTFRPDSNFYPPQITFDNSNRRGILFVDLHWDFERNECGVQTGLGLSSCYQAALAFDILLIIACVGSLMWNIFCLFKANFFKVSTARFLKVSRKKYCSVTQKRTSYSMS